MLLNPRKFGKSVTAIFNINTAPENPRDIIAQLEAMEELQVIYQTTGTYSIMAIGLFVDIEELNTFIEGKLSNSEILEYTVDVVRRKLKETTFQI